MDTPLRVLMVAEGSGGHLIPALEVARALTHGGAQVLLLYGRRKQLAGLLPGLVQEAHEHGIQLRALALRSPRRMLGWAGRLGQALVIWRITRQQLSKFQPDVIVGFGGWLSVPAIIAARQQHIPVMLHEQNVLFGRANRLLSRWADRVALSFAESAVHLSRQTVVTGLPIRPTIGSGSRYRAAAQFGLDPDRPTVLVLGGSQGSRALNRLVGKMLERLDGRERSAWQFIHLTGQADYEDAERAHAAAGIRSWVAPHLVEMALAYAMADVVIARAGASTIAELASCGKPAIFIPYPYAGGHQRENARVVESAGAAVQLEEATTSPERLLRLLRRLVEDRRLQAMMGAQMKTLARPDATQRLASAITGLAAVQVHAN